jgi:hypothetical protein
MNTDGTAIDVGIHLDETHVLHRDETRLRAHAPAVDIERIVHSGSFYENFTKARLQHRHLRVRTRSATFDGVWNVSGV